MIEKRPIGEVVKGFINGNDKALNELVRRQSELSGDETATVFASCRSKNNRRVFWPVVEFKFTKIDVAGRERIVESDTNGNSVGHYGRLVRRLIENEGKKKKQSQQSFRGRKALRPSVAA